MKEFFDFISYHNTWENYAMAFGIILLVGLIGRIMVGLEKKYLRKIAHKTPTKFDDVLINVLQMPFVCGLVLVGIYVSLHVLVLPAIWVEYIELSFKVLMMLDITWVINRFIKNLLNSYLLPKVASDKESKLDVNAVKAIQKIISGCIWIVALITAISMFGVDVAAMLTTLGVGGIAFALAAQDTIKNLFGGFTIFVDKPFKLGDRIQVAGFDGTVEEIGMRSTRIRTLAGRLVTIPNYKIVDSEIENVTAEDARKITLNLGLTYDTTPESMQEAMTWLKALPTQISTIKQDVIASFTTYGDFSLGITFIYYIKSRADIFETQSQVNLTILKHFNEKGWNFAFPTQTIYTQK